MDAAALAARFAAGVPELAGLPVRPLAAGTGHAAFDVGGVAVLRVRRDGDAAALAREARLTAALAPHLPLAVPDHRWLDPPVSGAPRLPGTPALAAAPPTAAAGRLVGAALRALHDLDPAPFAAIGVPADLDPSLRDWRDDALATVAGLERDGLLAGSTARDLAHLLGAPPSAGSVAPRLIHGDLAAEHVLVDADGTPTALIDWADACLGDPARDLAGLVHWGGMPLLAAAEATYGPVGPAGTARARWYAACRAAEDIAFGAARGRPGYVAGGRRALALLAAA